MVAAITGEDLIPALPRKHHLEFLAGGLGEQGRGQVGVVTHQLIRRPDGEGQTVEDVAGLRLDLPVAAAEAPRHLLRQGQFILDRGPGKTDGEGADGFFRAPAERRQEDGGVHPAGEEEAEGDIGAHVLGDDLVH